MKSAQVLKNPVKQPQMVYFKNDLIRCLVVNVDKEKNVCIVSLVENEDDFLELVIAIKFSISFGKFSNIV